MTNGPITNPFSTLATDPVRNFKFLVTFSPNTQDSTWASANKAWATMGFVSASGLSISTEAIAYREGGYNTNFHQIPGQTSFTPISFSKGVMLAQDANPMWMKRLFSVLSGDATTGIGADFRCTIDIAVLSHPNPQGTTNAGGAVAGKPQDQHVSMRFKVYNAWITNLSYSNLDAGANTLMVEEIQVVHEGFDVSYAQDYTTAGGAQALPSA